MTAVAGLVLAAGAGRRFGRPKALVELDGERLVDRAVRALAEGGCAPVHVVAGAVDLDVPGATVVRNDAWAGGMASSLRTGLAALPAEADAVVVSLVDQPGVGADAITRVVTALREGHRLVAASFDGVARNPVGIARPLWAAVAAEVAGDEGARTFLRAHLDLVTAIDCDDVADATDVDTPADLDDVVRVSAPRNPSTPPAPRRSRPWT